MKAFSRWVPFTLKFTDLGVNCFEVWLGLFLHGVMSGLNEYLACIGFMQVDFVKIVFGYCEIILPVMIGTRWNKFGVLPLLHIFSW